MTTRPAAPCSASPRKLAWFVSCVRPRAEFAILSERVLRARCLAVREQDAVRSDRILLQALDFAHDLVRKPRILFGTMRRAHAWGRAAMRSYKVSEFGQPLALVDAPTPRLTGTEVLLEVKAAGVCHSDLHIWEGGYELGHGRG